MLSLPRLTAASTLLIGIAPVGHSPAKTDRDRAELKGPVASVAVHWHSNHTDSYGDIDDRDLGTTTNDTAGNLLLNVEITPDFVRSRKPERHGPNVTVFRSVLLDAFALLPVFASSRSWR
ncbi:MAG: hypothetical protein ABI587_04870 [Gemmatimonadales bacterium]